MNKLYTIISIIICGILSVSCDDTVNPKAEFKEQYVLNCVINLDTTYQVATISRTFDVDGYDPNSNTVDPFLAGAVVKIYYNNLVYVMRDTLVTRVDTSRYKSPLHFYYLKNFKPSATSIITVEADLQNGKILKGVAPVYSLRRFYVGSSKKEIALPNPNSSSENNLLEFSWGELYATEINANLFFSPELVVLYSRENNGLVEKLEKRVPLYYLTGDRGEYPVYPQTSTRINTISYTMDVLNKAMEEISAGDPQKEKYKIEGALFRLLVMDRNLATYYSTQKTFLDEFSVRVNQPDFTNVTLGFGIVGSYSIQKLILPMEDAYISSFGYSY